MQTINEVTSNKIEDLLKEQKAHILYTYRERDPYILQLLTYIEAGIAAGEFVILVENERNYLEIKRELTQRLPEEQVKRLHYVNSIQFYLSSGSYEPAAIENYFSKTVKDYIENDIPFRSWAHVEWATLNGPVDLIEQYERVVDKAVQQLSFSLICAYDNNRIPPQLKEALLKTHPYVLDDNDLANSDLYDTQ